MGAASHFCLEKIERLQQHDTYDPQNRYYLLDKISNLQLDQKLFRLSCLWFTIPSIRAS
jgi:hypothetical protein